jgi:hypothetical protein
MSCRDKNCTCRHEGFVDGMLAGQRNDLHTFLVLVGSGLVCGFVIGVLLGLTV